jgi:hypothetical protein
MGDDLPHCRVDTLRVCLVQRYGHGFSAPNPIQVFYRKRQIFKCTFKINVGYFWAGQCCTLLHGIGTQYYPNERQEKDKKKHNQTKDVTLWHWRQISPNVFFFFFLFLSSHFTI